MAIREAWATGNMMVAQENTRMRGKGQSLKLIEVEEKIRESYATRQAEVSPPDRADLAELPLSSRLRAQKASRAPRSASIDAYASQALCQCFRKLFNQGL